MRVIADFHAGPGGGGVEAAPTFSLEQVLGQFLRWNARWEGPTVPFTFYTARPAHLSGQPVYNGFQAFTEAQREATLRAFSLIADIVPLNFVQVADTGQALSMSNQRLTFATSTTFPSYATGSAGIEWTDGLQLGSQHQIYGSETLFNPFRWAPTYEAGLRPFTVLLHEIMHGLGLPHPGDYNRNADEEITYAQHADYAQDSNQYTVMSYFGAHETGANHANRFAGTPLLHDIMAMQALYGANMTTRTGDTVYGFNSTAGRASLDFTQNTIPVVCLWDAGGVDTLDCSGYIVAQRLDLGQGAFSDVGGLTFNVSIAFGAWIENAIGGGGSDVVTGNALSNQLDGRAGADQLFGLGGDDLLLGGEGDDWLHGGAGSDRLFGGGGVDTAAFDGAASASKVLYRDGYVIVSGPNGVDELHGLEWLAFAGGTVNIDRPIVCFVDGETASAAKGSGGHGPDVSPERVPVADTGDTLDPIAWSERDFYKPGGQVWGPSDQSADWIF